MFIFNIPVSIKNHMPSESNELAIEWIYYGNHGQFSYFESYQKISSLYYKDIFWFVENYSLFNI